MANQSYNSKALCLQLTAIHIAGRSSVCRIIITITIALNRNNKAVATTRLALPKATKDALFQAIRVVLLNKAMEDQISTKEHHNRIHILEAHHLRLSICIKVYQSNSEGSLY